MMACGTRSCSEETPASWETATASDAPHTHCFTQATVCDPLGGLTFGNQDRPAFIAGLPALRPRLATGVLVSSEIGPSICQHIKQRTRPTRGTATRRCDGTTYVLFERVPIGSFLSRFATIGVLCDDAEPRRDSVSFGDAERCRFSRYSVRISFSRATPLSQSSERSSRTFPGPWALGPQPSHGNSQQRA
jgi:hypothetical protein